MGKWAYSIKNAKKGLETVEGQAEGRRLTNENGGKGE